MREPDDDFHQIPNIAEWPIEDGFAKEKDARQVEENNIGTGSGRNFLPFFTCEMSRLLQALPNALLSLGYIAQPSVALMVVPKHPPCV